MPVTSNKSVQTGRKHRRNFKPTPRLEWLTKLKGTFTYIHPFIVKNTIKDADEQPDDVCSVRYKRIQSTRISAPLD